MKIRTGATHSTQITEREANCRNTAYLAALESIVLLENDGVLPLNGKKVALYGNGVWKTIKGGTGSGEVNERYSVTILEGMENAGFQVTSRTWLQDYKAEYESGLEQFFVNLKKLMKTAATQMKMEAFSDAFGASYQHPYGRPITEEDVRESDTDVCIYVLSRQSGESMDRDPDTQMFHLAQEELEHIRFLTTHYAKTVVVLNIGACMDLCSLKEIEGINAIVHIGLLGCEGGNAFADIISGKVSPSGRLASTWMKKYEDVPYGRAFGKMSPVIQQQDFKEGIYVGYRYYDTFGVTPQYPFGYGLSYTTFSYDVTQIQLNGSEVCASVTVTNASDRYSGKEVIQLYIGCPAGKLDKPVKQLAAFAKTKTLLPGESQTLQLRFDMRDHASYFEKEAQFKLEQGDYKILLGTSSRNTQLFAYIWIAQDTVVSQHRSMGMPAIAFRELCPPEQNPEAREDVPVLEMAADAIAPIVHRYDPLPVCEDPQVQKVLDTLSVKECIDLIVGDGLDILGKPHDFICPGVSGYSTSTLVRKGIPCVNFADGPAGLRLQQRSAVLKDRLKPADPFATVFAALPKWIVRLMTADPETSELVYQYTTAYPAGHTLAQSWNTELVEAVGHAVGAEMLDYGVTFWLAPGVNIHRNPLNGRNFEYYSEDPLLAGKMAAAITRGVQHEKGVYATPKHFFCNSQEEDRGHMSSNVSERAVREIYMPAFRIAVQEGGAKAIMSSYNKVNGTYTSNHYPALTMVLRNEWGFDGLVMTDWMTTTPGASDPALCVSAGNDLLMCGLGSDKKAIKKALKTGKITEDDLRRCAANALKLFLQARK